MGGTCELCTSQQVHLWVKLLKSMLLSLRSGRKGTCGRKKLRISAGIYNLFGTVALHEAFMLLVAVVFI